MFQKREPIIILCSVLFQNTQRLILYLVIIFENSMNYITNFIQYFYGAKKSTALVRLCAEAALSILSAGGNNNKLELSSFQLTGPYALSRFHTL